MSNRSRLLKNFDLGILISACQPRVFSYQKILDIKIVVDPIDVAKLPQSVHRNIEMLLQPYLQSLILQMWWVYNSTGIMPDYDLIRKADEVLHDHLTNFLGFTGGMTSIESGLLAGNAKSDDPSLMALVRSAILKAVARTSDKMESLLTPFLLRSKIENPFPTRLWATTTEQVVYNVYYQLLQAVYPLTVVSGRIILEALVYLGTIAIPLLSKESIARFNEIKIAEWIVKLAIETDSKSEGTSRLLNLLNGLEGVPGQNEAPLAAVEERVSLALGHHRPHLMNRFSETIPVLQKIIQSGAVRMMYTQTSSFRTPWHSLLVDAANKKKIPIQIIRRESYPPLSMLSPELLELRRMISLNPQF